MQDKLLNTWKGFTGKLKELSSKLNKRNRMIAIGAAVLILAVAVGGAIMLNTASKAVLFTQVTQEEAAEIVAKISEMGIQGSYNSDGSISVPADEADSLRAELVLQGYPKSGLSYNTFKENVNSLSTDYDKNIYAIYDLQDRVASTIRHFNGVKDAAVVFSIGSNDRYVLTKDKQDASAWATVYMQPGATLEDDQVKGIQRLVAKSISGLKDENVSVFDGDGRDLTLTASSQGTNGTAQLKRALEQEVENSISAKIMHLLGPVYQSDNIRVSVTADVDVKKKIQENLTYIPATEDNKGVMKSETTGTEITGNGTATAGNPGTDTNAQIPIYPNVNFDGENIYYNDDKSFEYAVSQMKEQIQDDGGDVLDTSVSVVINAKKLSTTEITEIKRLVAMTANINLDQMNDKIAVMTGTFSADPNANLGGGTAVDTLMQYKWILLAGVVLLLALILLASKLRGKKAQLVAQDGVLHAEGSLQEDGEPDILSIKLEEMKKTREMELKEQIRDFAEANPEISAQLIRTWLKGGGGGDD